MDPILEIFREALLGDPQVRAVVSRGFTEALTKAIATMTPNQLGDLLIQVGEAIKTPSPPTP